MRLFKGSVREVTCPGCGEREAFAPCCGLFKGEVESGGKVVMRGSGFRLSCQNCGMVFSVTASRTFHHHPQSLPWTPVPQAQTPQAVQRPEETGERARILPMADARPKPIFPKSGA